MRPEIHTLMLPDGQMGVVGQWPWTDGKVIRHGVRVPPGALEEAKQKLEKWYAQRQAEAKAASEA